MLNRNRAQAGYNIPHMFVIGFVAELPFGKDGTAFANNLIKDWQINGSFSAYQGRPFNLRASGASLAAPGNVQTPDQVKSEVKRLGGIGPGQPFYDPTAFKSVTEPRFGNVGRNPLRGPGLKNLDFSLFRTFRLTERYRLQFRTEAFNLTNTPHFNNPRANVSQGNFLVVTSAQNDERQFRFGLRLGF